MLLLTLLALALFQQMQSDPSAASVLTEVVAGVVASFVLSVIKRLAKREGGIKIGGSAAHALTLGLAVVVSLAVRYYLGEIDSWTALVKSMGVVAMSSVATYHFLIEKFGLIEAKPKKES